MPVVYLPLGSQSASGAFGNLIVYQGTSVRSYVVPRDPRTGAQLDQRHLFADINKTTHAAGAWLRVALKTVYGSRWFTALFQDATANPYGYWQIYTDEYNTYSDEVKLTWQENAPWLATYNDPGLIFFCLVNIVYIRFEGYGVTDWMPGDYFTDPVADLAFWKRDLSGAIAAGLTESDDSRIRYLAGSWSTVNDAEASGGSYEKCASGLNSYFEVTYFGAQITLYFVAQPGSATVSISEDGFSSVSLNLNDTETTYAFEWVSNLQKRGLHQVSVLGGAGGMVSIDAFHVRGTVPKTTIPKIVGANFALGVLEMAEQSVQPPTPAVENSKLYFLDDGKLYKLASDGTPVEIVPGAITQAEADELYAALVHAHSSYVEKSTLGGRMFLPFGVYTHISPMSVTGSAPYTATVDRLMLLEKITYSFIVLTTNNGSNYWKLSLKGVVSGTTYKELNTSAATATVWSQVSDTISSAEVSSGEMLYLICDKVGSPGNLYLAGPALEIAV